MLRSLLLPAVTLPATIACAVALASDWTNWRGPNHDGISVETDLALVWKGKPKILWERQIGAGFSGVAGVGERVFTCGTEDRKQVLFCLDASSGKVIWKRAIGRELREGMGGDGPRATPALSDGRVYIFGGHGTLLCAAARTGKQIWKRSYNNPPDWSYSGSVLIEGPLAIISPGKRDGGLLALDRKSGKAIWKAGNDGAGYATPYPFTFEGKRYILGFLATQAIIVEARTGRQVWSKSWRTSYDVNAATPIYHEGHLFISSGYGTGCALLQLRRAGSRLEAPEVWRNREIRNKFQTCILYEGTLYGADEQSLKCVDWMTGKLFWSERRIEGSGTQHGTVVLVGDHLVFLSPAGQLQVARASPRGYEPLASAKILSGRCWTVPTLHNGRLYMRNLRKLVCLDLRK